MDLELGSLLLSWLAFGFQGEHLGEHPSPHPTVKPGHPPFPLPELGEGGGGGG